MKWDKPMTDQTSLRNLLQKPCFACRYAAREKGRGKGRKKREGEKGRNECVPSYDSSVQGHTKKEGLPAMAKPSRDTQARKGKRERERERERKRKERGGEREGKKGEGTGVPSYEQASRDTPGRGVCLSVTFRSVKPDTLEIMRTDSKAACHTATWAKKGLSKRKQVSWRSSLLG